LVLKHLRRLAATHPVRDLSDGQLLQRFAGLRDQGAFAVIVQRHGSMVFRVCRNVLQHQHDAEDAAQATFLVLARRANSIQNRQALAGWLHGVAYRIAMRAKRDAMRRRSRESNAMARPQNTAESELAWRELQELLDAEMQRLPEKYRTPFVLCCLESNSKPEAARLLGWKEGTVSSRLAQARKLLQQRLARRGVTLSTVLGGLALARASDGATPSPLDSILQAAASPTASGLVTARAAALAKGLLTIMWLKKSLLIGVLVLSLGAGMVGVGVLPGRGSGTAPAGQFPATAAPKQPPKDALPD
jgi:RNA polymerase sigma factor (sigma-70 family)